MESKKQSMATIKEFSKLTGLSQRVLRHYHEIELLIPEFINHKAYRFYGSQNFETVQQILFFKELGFSLKKIQEIIYTKRFDKIKALKTQRLLLDLKQQRLSRILSFIDELLSKGNIEMNEKMKKAFDADEINNKRREYVVEAKQKWGSTNSYQQSLEKLKNYSKSDIETINKEQSKIYSGLAQLMSKEVSDGQVQEKILQARIFISKNWYDCSEQAFAGLGQMYISDIRFKDHLDQYGEGFAKFLSDGIVFYSNKKKGSFGRYL